MLGCEVDDLDEALALPDRFARFDPSAAFARFVPSSARHLHVADRPCAWRTESPSCAAVAGIGGPGLHQGQGTAGVLVVCPGREEDRVCLASAARRASLDRLALEHE